MWMDQPSLEIISGETDSAGPNSAPRAVNAPNAAHPAMASASMAFSAAPQSGPQSGPGAPAHVSFDRRELSRILNLYGRKVASGEWRDYAIDFLKDRAVFSIFRRASEVPIYRIEKDPRLARKQGAYSVISATGLILRRGHELERVLLVIDKPVKVVS
jgi:hypothetical protein